MRATHLISFLSLAALPCAVPALTLREAQEALFRDNADLAVLRLESERAESQWSEARAAWLPSVDALGNYSYTTETPSLNLDLPFPPPGGTHIDKALGDHDKVELGADASYALFTGFARGNATAARRAGAQASEAKERAARNQMSLRLAGLYYAWQLAAANAEYQTKVLQHARELQKQLEDFVKAGTAVRSRALTAQARAKAAEVDQLSAENTRDSLAYEVFDFMGRRDTAGASPEALAPDTSALPPPDWTDSSGAAQRPEIEALDRNEDQARLSGKALLGQKWPQLYAMAGWRYANPGLNMADDAFMSYGILGVQLKWNLFDGSKNGQQRRQLDIQGRILEEQKRKLRGEWWKSLRSARLQYDRWEAQWAAAQASRDAARASAADLKRQFEAGVATGIDWLEARNNEARAELMMDQARTMQRLAALQWRYAAGKELRF